MNNEFNRDSLVLSRLNEGMVMLCEQVGRHDRLFYEFNLEDRVPGDHPLRRITAVARDGETIKVAANARFMQGYAICR